MISGDSALSSGLQSIPSVIALKNLCPKVADSTVKLVVRLCPQVLRTTRIKASSSPNCFGSSLETDTYCLHCLNSLSIPES
jgi:hypothetical protein